MLVSDRHIFQIPESVASCPYCGSKISAKAFTFSRIDGQWKAIGIGLKCRSEPTPGSGVWKEWSRQHSVNPLIHRAPVEQTVKLWINSQFNFKEPSP